MNSKGVQIVSEREAAIKTWLKDLVEVKGAKLPVSPEQIYEALDSIDTEAAINEFSPDTAELQVYVNNNHVEALVFEWFYDGGSPGMGCFVEEGYGYRKCAFDGAPGHTDLLTIDGNEGFEMDPELEDAVDESYAGLCLDPVMNVWYNKLAIEFKDKFDEYYNLNSNAGNAVDLDEVNDAYSELFHLKLVALMRQSYMQALQNDPITITKGKPLHVFIKRHERWPLHIISLNI